MATPVLSHLDPDFIPLLDDVRSRLGQIFQAPEGSLTIAVSGTGTSGMEATVANLVSEGTHALVVVNGYFGERIAELCRRYGANISRVDVEWGRAVDPGALRSALRACETGIDLVAMVHAETSTGVLNPVADLATVAREHGALTLVDTVSSLGGHPVDVAGWGVDAVYSCTQKCLGAPSGMSPVAWTPGAQDRAVGCRSFYLDLSLLEDYWVRHKYHHTLSASMLYALREALVAIDEEGLEARWARHRRHHEALACGIEALGLELLPPSTERLWTVNAVCVPSGIDEAEVRHALLTDFSIEIGTGLGPLAGKIWRVGLMGASSTPSLVLLFLSTFGRALKQAGFRCDAGAGVEAAATVL
jgi:alanine-glyoxylate transaminase/serine-glyoxylate transaminase/serine-pyruvate transaminase